MSQKTLTVNDPSQKVEDMDFELPQPDPIKGFPELRWSGKRPFKSTHYYPAQLKESYGDPVDGWYNRIYWGDNLQVMSHLLKEFRGKVDLVYIDPPFDSKAEYKKTINLKGQTANSDNTSFEDKQYSDIWTNDKYLQFIYERLILINELLSQHGICAVHCDFNKGNYIRCILDEVFGYKNFLNDIVWFYENKPQFGFMKHLPHDHDYIFVYSKNRNGITLNHQQVPVKAVQKQAIVSWDPILKKRVAKRDESGKIVYENRDQKYMGSVWPLPLVHPIALERTGYPTQKPETILDRLLRVFSNPGDLVMDCFMGSGTTQAVAVKLGRRFIGADINLGAIQTTTKRLESIISEKKKEKQLLLEEGDQLYLNFQVYTVNNYEVFRNPVQARDLLIETLEIDKLESTDVFDGTKDDYYVKIMPVNRIATRADLNSILSGINYRDLDRKIEEAPGSPAIRIMLVCMGHEPDLAAHLEMDIGKQYRPQVKVVDILRDKKGLTFKYDSEADIAIEGGELVIRQFYPRNLLQKLSIEDENVDDWRELVETIAIDWNYNGEVLQPAVYDNPGKNELVKGRYRIPADYGNIRVKITDLLSESLEMTIGEV